MNVYEKLQNCRVELQGMNIRKSGKNKFAGFSYFELGDFLPHINDLFNKYKLFSNFSIKDNTATLTIINTEAEEKIEFTSPIAQANVKGCTEIQSLGAIHTYMKRYLYMNALEIVDSDMLDAETGSENFVAENNDIDLIEGINACSDKTSLEIYKSKYINSASDKTAFRSAYFKRLSDLNKGVK